MEYVRPVYFDKGSCNSVEVVRDGAQIAVMGITDFHKAGCYQILYL